MPILLPTPSLWFLLPGSWFLFPGSWSLVPRRLSLPHPTAKNTSYNACVQAVIPKPRRT
jgi:hypothetical protein